MTTDSPFAEQWTRFLERFASLNQRLTSSLQASCADLRNIFESQVRSAELTATDANPSDLTAFRNIRNEATGKLLRDPFSEWERLQPYSRALAAVEAYEHSLEELVRILPAAIPVNGPMVHEALGTYCPAGFRRRLSGLRRKQFAIPLRAIVGGEFHRAFRSRMSCNGRFLQSSAVAARELRALWELAREAIDGSMHAHPLAPEEMVGQQRETRDRIELNLSQAEAAVKTRCGWVDLTLGRLGRRIVTAVLWHTSEGPPGSAGNGTAILDHWAELLRTVEADLRMDLALAHVEDRTMHLLQQALKNLEAELHGLMIDLECTIEWLRNKEARDLEKEEFPRPKTEVVPSSSRLAELDIDLDREIKALPDLVRVLLTLSSLPPRRREMKQYHPRQTFRQAFERTGRPAIARVFEDIVPHHRKITQGIERVRQVVSFAAERIAGEKDPESPVAREALQNALSLLEFYRDEPPELLSSASHRLAQTLAAVFAENRLVLTRNRLGVMAYLARQGFRRAVVLVGKSALTMSGQGLRRLWRAQEKMTLRFLVYIGWKQAPSAGKVQVVTRPYLPREFVLNLSASGLPALYRYLFRHEAVQDPRFLVGREQEMSAIAQARSFWQQGRPTALIIVGERGSGKTSLINCALKRSLSDLEVISGAVGERLVTGARLQDFLVDLVGGNDADALPAMLAQRQRVIILEEVERTFLRQVDHYGAIRELQRLIASTCASTLWILSINKVAFQFLNAAVNLGQTFSHRINAGTASRNDLQQAILLRHNLSGLRAQFPEPLQPQDPISRLKRAVQERPDAMSVFFDILASQSAGIYRTAFDLWAGQIEAIQGGALYLKTFAVRDLSAVTEDLNLGQLFTLVALLQHGGLTPEEHALVFQKNIAASRAQIDELLAREIIEADPGREGFRIRPEAMPVVKDALYRRNLL